jgi:hypothetical protein
MLCELSVGERYTVYRLQSRVPTLIQSASTGGAHARAGVHQRGQHADRQVVGDASVRHPVRARHAAQPRRAGTRRTPKRSPAATQRREKLRIGRSGFGTARQNMRLERGTNPTRGFFSILSLSVQLVIAPSGDPTSADTPRSLHARLRWDGGTYHTCEPRHVSSGQPAVLEGM